MIDFVGYVCPKHIAIGAMSLPDRFEDVCSPLHAQQVCKDKYTQLTFMDRHENRSKITRF